MLRNPAEGFADAAGVADQLGRVAFAAGAKLRGDIFPGDALDCVDHLAHGVAGAGAEVQRDRLAAIDQIL